MPKVLYINIYSSNFKCVSQFLRRINNVIWYCLVEIYIWHKLLQYICIKFSTKNGQMQISQNINHFDICKYIYLRMILYCRLVFDVYDCRKSAYYSNIRNVIWLTYIFWNRRLYLIFDETIYLVFNWFQEYVWVQKLIWFLVRSM